MTISIMTKKLMEHEKIWNALNTVSMSTLNANIGLEDYDKLQDTFLAFGTLVQSLGHTQRNQAISAYENYTRVF